MLPSLDLLLHQTGFTTDTSFENDVSRTVVTNGGDGSRTIAPEGDSHIPPLFTFLPIETGIVLSLWHFP